MKADTFTELSQNHSEVTWVISAWMNDCTCVRVLSHVRLFVTPQTVACQAALSRDFCRQRHWSGLPCLPPGALLDPGIKLVSLTSPELLAGRFFTTILIWTNGWRYTFLTSLLLANLSCSKGKIHKLMMVYLRLHPPHQSFNSHSSTLSFWHFLNYSLFFPTLLPIPWVFLVAQTGK